MWLNGPTMHLFLRWDRCEKGVMSSVNVRNCIRFYQTAEELNATTLMNYCGEIIASHWVSTTGFMCACIHWHTCVGWMVFYQSCTRRAVGTENDAAWIIDVIIYILFPSVLRHQNLLFLINMKRLNTPTISNLLCFYVV